MFGMEKKKNNEVERTIFEMETSIKQNPHKRKELTEDMESRCVLLKGYLQQTDDEQLHNKFALLLNGYTAFIKVINRI